MWETSDVVKLSSWCRGCGVLPSCECFGFVVGLAGGEAVVQAAQVAVEQVAKRGGVAFAARLAAEVVLACGAWPSGCAEGPDEAGLGEPVVFDPAVLDRDRAARGPSDWGCAGIGFQRASVSEPGPVVADLGQDSGAVEVAEAGEAGDDFLVGVLGERCRGGLG